MKKAATGLLTICLVIISISLSAQLNKAYFYYQGQRLITQNKFTESIVYLNRLIDVDSTIAEGWFLRGVAKYYLNDLQGSMQDFSKSIAKNPLFTQAYHYRAIVYNRLSKYNNAFKDLEFALELRPESEEILFTRGGTYIETMQYNKAIQDFTKVIKLSPSYIDSWLNRGIAKLCTHDTIGAIDDFSHAIKLNPFYAESYGRRSRVYFEKKEYSIALVDINQALNYDSTSTMNYFIRGLIFYSMKNYNKAEKDFDKVISIDPDNSLSLYNRALIKAQTGALNSAIEDYDKLAKLNPNNVLVFYNRASVNFELEKFNDAINDYTSAINLFPDFANAYYNRSVAKNRIGDLKGAEQDYNNANEKVKKYKASSQDAYLAMADTSKKFNSLMEFDTDFSDGFTNINLKNDISLPTGFLPFYILQVADEKVKTPFRDYKTAYINELNRRLIKGFQFLYSQSNDQNNQFNKPGFKFDTTAIALSTLHFYKALGLSSTKKYSLAIAEYEQALKNDPKNQIIALNLAVEKVEMVNFISQFNSNANAVSFKLGNVGNISNDQSKSINFSYNEAIDKLKDIEIDLPDLSVIPYNIGNTYLLIEELDLAINQYDKAIQLEPRFSEAWFNRGLAKLIKGDKQSGCLDVSKSGELGQNQAYSIIQKFCK